MSSIKNIKALEKKRQLLIEKIITTQEMIRGSFGTIYRKCGKPNCWCSQGNGHPATRITWTEKAKSKTKVIPKQDIIWIKSMTKNYRKFRKIRQEMRILEKELNNIIDDLEAEIVNKTKRLKDYLD